MKEGITMAGPAVRIVDRPIPEPNDDQWVASGNIISPILEGIQEPVNQGDDIAGIVEKVGSNVIEFKPGDRVAAFYEMYTKGGSYAEYAVAWSHTTFHLPDHTPFEEAATVPLAALTAAVSLYANHRLPFPWRPAQAPTPLVIYGASTAVGAFAIKLACNSNIHPIISVAGKGCGYVESIVDKSKGDIVIDYRHGLDKTVSAIKSHLGNCQPVVKHALDAAITADSTEVLKQIVTPGGLIDVHNAALGFIFCRYLTRALQDKTLRGHPYEVRPGGLAGIEGALKDLKAGKASARKYVFRIAETPGTAA
ncbi:chaperonin 10-like protein [Aspergillus filifer]